jgi:hypothetical protein
VPTRRWSGGAVPIPQIEALPSSAKITVFIPALPNQT